YAQMLRGKLHKHQAQVWLVNTGWTAGPFGKGHRFPLMHTRRLVSAALNNELEGASFTPDPVFGVLVPRACPGVPADLLQPRSTWKNTDEYDAKARQLAKLFQENFQKYAAKASAEVKAAGPKME